VDQMSAIIGFLAYFAYAAVAVVVMAFIKEEL
jgi:hypothetical protein